MGMGIGIKAREANAMQKNTNPAIPGSGGESQLDGKYEVSLRIKVTVLARDVIQAEHRVLDLMEDVLADLTGKVGVAEAAIPLTATNPEGRRIFVVGKGK